MVATTTDRQHTDYVQMLSHSPWRKIRQGQKWYFTRWRLHCCCNGDTRAEGDRGQPDQVFWSASLSPSLCPQPNLNPRFFCASLSLTLHLVNLHLSFCYLCHCLMKSRWNTDENSLFPSFSPRCMTSLEHSICLYYNSATSTTFFHMVNYENQWSIEIKMIIDLLSFLF